MSEGHVYRKPSKEFVEEAERRLGPEKTERLLNGVKEVLKENPTLYPNASIRKQLESEDPPLPPCM
jgi:hypothetical protein